MGGIAMKAEQFDFTGHKGTMGRIQRTKIEVNIRVFANHVHLGVDILLKYGCIFLRDQRLTIYNGILQGVYFEVATIRGLQPVKGHGTGNEHVF